MKDYDKLTDKEKYEYGKMVTFRLALGDIEGIVELISWSETTTGKMNEKE